MWHIRDVIVILRRKAKPVLPSGGAIFMREMVPMSPNDMLRALADIWATCVIDYPEADHAEILRHIEALQGIVFGLDK
jgi:hypothetical protein